MSDSLKADINIESCPHFEIENFSLEFPSIADLKEANRLIDEQEVRINKKKGITKRDSDKWDRINEVRVLLSPLKIKPTEENFTSKDKKSKFPFWYAAQMSREGKLKPTDETFPIFQRRYLEPLVDEKTEFIFSSVDSINNTSAMGKEKYQDYTEYINHVKNIFRLVTNQEIDTYSVSGHQIIHHAIVLLPDEEKNAAEGIIQLYTQILKEKDLPELLKAFITLKNENQKNPIAVADLIHSNFLHTGQMGFDFPLSISQRKSLYTFLQGNDKVFAVNGPPGTGKTTLLQSVVANHFVECAIEGNDAPIILACSTNNQAVTNIIASFSKSNTRTGDLQGRWLPDIEGYATYLPAESKKDEELKGINYKKTRGGGLFSRIENTDFLKKAEDYFIEKSKKYFNKQTSNLKKEEVVGKLQQEIIQIQAILKDASLKWNEYAAAEKIFLASWLTANTRGKEYYQNNLLNEAAFKTDIVSLTTIESRILYYFNNEPFFRKLFCFLGLKFALSDRASEVNIILRDSLIEFSPGLACAKSAILAIVDAKIKTAKNSIAKIQNWKNWKIQNSIFGNPPKSEEEYQELELLKIKNKAQPHCFYDELDVSFRHKAFQLALHYWEGRYLIKLEQDLKSYIFTGETEVKVKNRWKRQAMLTPCFVSTFYMAPKFFQSYKHLGTGDDGKGIADFPPLFNFIDLLIVDEAGQVSPEVGVAAFALAKQALIVGDIKQIEPVWNITGKVDVGNLKKCQLIASENDPVVEKEFDPKGFLSSTGSLMKMAQNACHYKQIGLPEKGVILVEHRRCYNEIINYCNDLAYGGQLKPLRGMAKNDLLFPPMYCIHIDGNSVKSSTSRYNRNEVNAIADWLVKNRNEILKKYGKLEDAVGIITPFVGQKNLLIEALKQKNIDTGILKIGTVHALQGAERPIILFSMVYGKGDSGTLFFDRDNKPNMLNVAVSRAQDNFIVFANTEIFNKTSRTPSGILSNYLTYA